ncbi:hypothetical protein [Paucihalobacter sp.]|uniref:hypothetical protein n=1 Tax=Paucihalobacter sp. TaxID=2850405 RepID=UPI002FE158C6
MKFIHRLGYYLGGFAIGLVILAFFLNGKDASCDYTPNARTTKFLSKLPKTYSESSEQFLIDKEIDSSTLNNLIRFGDVDFKNSNTKGEPCKTYYIDSKLKEEFIRLHIENCDEKVKILIMESILD